jgi:hypothetical protein
MTDYPSETPMFGITASGIDGSYRTTEILARLASAPRVKMHEVLVSVRGVLLHHELH